MYRSLPCLLLLVTGAVRAEVIDVSEATNLRLAIHPQNEYIAIDLLGGLWRLPLTGGGATALIPAGSGVAQPRFDSSGEQIVFQRWLNGQWDIWVFSAATGEYRPLTETEFDEREPDFSPDGQQVVFAGDRDGRYSLWSLDLETSALRKLTDEPGNARFPTFDDNGALAYVNTNGMHSDIRIYADDPRGETLIESGRVLDAPSWRPGGGVLVINERGTTGGTDLWLHIDADEPVSRRLTAGEDVFVGRSGWLSPEEYVYAADGAIWRRRIGSLERSRILLFAGVNVEEIGTDFVDQPLDAPGPHRIAGINSVVRHEPTGRTAFSALGDLWLVEDDQVTRLTDDALSDAWPTFSPDGEWLVFASDRGGSMDLWRYRIETGQLLQISDGPGRVFSPRVSADGRFVAYFETAGYAPWDGVALRIIDFDHPFQPATIATGLFDAGGLTWQGSYLRLSARERPNGESFAQVFETDADDEIIAAVTAPIALPQSIDDEALLWQPAAAEEPYVIQAERLFDGVSSQYAYHVDIHISGQRITEIVARDRLPLPDRVVDLTDRTVMPGLIDVHAHLATIAGSDAGKLWLRHGVTTVRDVSNDWRAALERAETWASGQHPGPRVVISPLRPADAGELPAGSPIIVSGSRRIVGGGTHALASQWARDGDARADLTPVALGTAAAGGPRLAFSANGRSYDDVFGQIRASRVYFATGLATLAAAEPSPGVDQLTNAFERVLRNSGRIAIGSDAPTVPYGSGFHRELELLADRGVATDQVLRYATGGGALALGLSLQLGTLEAGRLADLLVIDGDPLSDLEDLERLEAVVVGGVWHDVGALDTGR